MVSRNTTTNIFPFAITNTNVPRLRPCGRLAADCRRYSGGIPYFGLYHSTTQGKYPTWRAARLPPLQVRPLWYRFVDTVWVLKIAPDTWGVNGIHCHFFKKAPPRFTAAVQEDVALIGTSSYPQKQSRDRRRWSW